VGRGGAAHKVLKFCGCCEMTNLIRGNLIIDGVEYDHHQWDSMKRIWKEKKDISLFHPLKTNINDRIGEKSLPGVTPKRFTPCIMHGDMRFDNNTCTYLLNDVRKSSLSREEKLAIFRQFQDWINIRIIGTPEFPGSWKIIIRDQSTLEFVKFSFLHRVCDRIMYLHEEMLLFLEPDSEKRELSKIIFSNYIKAHEIFHTGKTQKKPNKQTRAKPQKKESDAHIDMS
jgi:hypothetical protein